VTDGSVSPQLRDLAQKAVAAKGTADPAVELAAGVAFVMGDGEDNTVGRRSKGSTVIVPVLPTSEADEAVVDAMVARKAQGKVTRERCYCTQGTKWADERCPDCGGTGWADGGSPGSTEPT
jgi:hypothetical protein